jgi:hypothetical protein
MKKLLMAVAAVMTLSSAAMSAEVLAGGSIPLINNVVGIGVMTLDFSSAATLSEIAIFIINNNSTSFDLNLTFLNRASFKNAAGVAIAMSALTLGGGGLGTLGTGPVSLGVFPLPGTSILADAQAVGGLYTWNPVNQSTATVNYSLSLKASWALFTGLAGLYTESITASIVATM